MGGGGEGGRERGGVNLKYFPWRGGGECEKFKKRGWKYGAGAGLLKREGGGVGWLAIFLFSRFIIFAFRNKLVYLLQIVLCI